MPILKSAESGLQGLPLLPGWRDLQETLQNLLSRDKSAAARLEAALEAQSHELYGDFLTGVERYRAAPFFRDLEPAPSVWRAGTTQLRDYGTDAADGRPPLLVIPSLVNRYTVLDMDATQSLMRTLAQRFHPYLIDWDAPGPEESAFGLDAYFSERLLPALAFVTARHGRPAHVAGYCMGGTLAAALAQLAPRQVKSLLFLAAPWDFHAADGQMPYKAAALAAMLDPLLEQWGELPPDVLQAFFVSLQPFALVEKFARFAHEAEGGAAEKLFVLVEDWVNDGVPLPRSVARECLCGWYAENSPARGNWRVLGQFIAPQALRLPSLHVIPRHDKIVPQASAAALADMIPESVRLTPELGHISMMVNGAARDMLWPQLLDWLASAEA